MQNHRPHPHVVIPHDARRPNADVYSSYALELRSGSNTQGLLNPLALDAATPTARQPRQPTTHHSIQIPHTLSRTHSALESVSPNLDLQVLDTQIYRSSSQRQPTHNTAHEYYHRSTKSDSILRLDDDYSSRSDLTSPFSPSISLPADEVGSFLYRVVLSALIWF